METKLDSSALDFIDFHKVAPDKKPVLDVRFKAGSKYRYFGVPENIVNEMLNANSKGQYFIENIRNRYQYEKIPS